jgi:hypothetical protein
MKKELLVLGMFIIVSCNTPQNEIPLDCNCDKVVEKTTFNVVGTTQNPSITYHTVYTTINECTHIQRTKSYDTKDSGLIPQVGQCR